jgi:hypothetical protein
MHVGGKFGIFGWAFKRDLARWIKWIMQPHELPHPPAKVGDFASRPGWRRTGADHRAGRSPMVPRRAPVARSMTTSRLAPSGRANCRMRRSGAAVIASIRAPRGRSNPVAKVLAAAAAPAGRSPRAMRPAMTAATTPKPMMITAPMTMTKTVRARIGPLCVSHEGLGVSREEPGRRRAPPCRALA